MAVAAQVAGGYLCCNGHDKINQDLNHPVTHLPSVARMEKGSTASITHLSAQLNKKRQRTTHRTAAAFFTLFSGRFAQVCTRSGPPYGILWAEAYPPLSFSFKGGTQHETTQPHPTPDGGAGVRCHGPEPVCACAGRGRRARRNAAARHLPRGQHRRGVQG